MYIINILYCLVLVLVLGCDKASDPGRIISKTTLPPLREYSIIASNSGWGIGEDYEYYILCIPPKEYLKIKNDIVAKPFYLPCGSNDARTYSIAKATGESAGSCNQEYYYSIVDSTTGNEVGILLEKDSIMHISYDDP